MMNALLQHATYRLSDHQRVDINASIGRSGGFRRQGSLPKDTSDAGMRLDSEFCSKIQVLEQ